MILSAGMPAFAGKEEPKNENISIEARMTNLKTGEIVNLDTVELLDIKQNGSKCLSATDTENRTLGVKVETKLQKSRVTAGDSETGGGVDSYLYVDYSLKKSNGIQYIRVDRIRGSWNPSSTYITMSGRAVDYGDGKMIGGNEGHKKPTSNTFSYTTGWGYTEYLPATDYSGARAYSCATASMSGGANYLIECFVRVSSL